MMDWRRFSPIDSKYMIGIFNGHLLHSLQLFLVYNNVIVGPLSVVHFHHVQTDVAFPFTGVIAVQTLVGLKLGVHLQMLDQLKPPNKHFVAMNALQVGFVMTFQMTLVLRLMSKRFTALLAKVGNDAQVNFVHVSLQAGFGVIGFPAFRAQMRFASFVVMLRNVPSQHTLFVRHQTQAFTATSLPRLFVLLLEVCSDV